MAFTAKILSWRFRHLNIVGCLLKRRPTKGGGGVPQDPPLPATPLFLKYIVYIRFGLMHVVVVDWLSVKETVTDELDKQLRVEENHDYS